MISSNNKCIRVRLNDTHYRKDNFPIEIFDDNKCRNRKSTMHRWTAFFMKIFIKRFILSQIAFETCNKSDYFHQNIRVFIRVLWKVKTLLSPTNWWIPFEKYFLGGSCLKNWMKFYNQAASYQEFIHVSIFSNKIIQSIR